MKPDQLQLPAIAEVEHRLRTPSRTMSASSLRPGDWLRSPTGLMFCVLQNSAKLKKVELWFENANWMNPKASSFVYDYEQLTAMTLVAHGEPRYYWYFLPAWLQRRVCMYRRVK